MKVFISALLISGASWAQYQDDEVNNKVQQIRALAAAKKAAVIQERTQRMSEAEARREAYRIQREQEASVEGEE